MADFIRKFKILKILGIVLVFFLLFSQEKEVKSEGGSLDLVDAFLKTKGVHVSSGETYDVEECGEKCFTVCKNSDCSHYDRYSYDDNYIYIKETFTWDTDTGAETCEGELAIGVFVDRREDICKRDTQGGKWLPRRITSGQKFSVDVEVFGVANKKGTCCSNTPHSGHFHQEVSFLFYDCVEFYTQKRVKNVWVVSMGNGERFFFNQNLGWIGWDLNGLGYYIDQDPGEERADPNQSCQKIGGPLPPPTGDDETAGISVDPMCGQLKKENIKKENIFVIQETPLPEEKCEPGNEWEKAWWEYSCEPIIEPKPPPEQEGISPPPSEAISGVAIHKMAGCEEQQVGLRTRLQFIYNKIDKETYSVFFIPSAFPTCGEARCYELSNPPNELVPQKHIFWIVTAPGGTKTGALTPYSGTFEFFPPAQYLPPQEFTVDKTHPATVFAAFWTDGGCSHWDVPAVLSCSFWIEKGKLTGKCDGADKLFSCPPKPPPPECGKKIMKRCVKERHVCAKIGFDGNCDEWIPQREYGQPIVAKECKAWQVCTLQFLLSQKKKNQLKCTEQDCPRPVLGWDGIKKEEVPHKPYEYELNNGEYELKMLEGDETYYWVKEDDTFFIDGQEIKGKDLYQCKGWGMCLPPIEMPYYFDGRGNMGNSNVTLPAEFGWQVPPTPMSGWLKLISETNPDLDPEGSQSLHIWFSDSKTGSIVLHKFLTVNDLYGYSGGGTDDEKKVIKISEKFQRANFPTNLDELKNDRNWLDSLYSQTFFKVKPCDPLKTPIGNLFTLSYSPAQEGVKCLFSPGKEYDWRVKLCIEKNPENCGPPDIASYNGKKEWEERTFCGAKNGWRFKTSNAPELLGVWDIKQDDQVHPHQKIKGNAELILDWDWNRKRLMSLVLGDFADPAWCPGNGEAYGLRSFYKAEVFETKEVGPFDPPKKIFQKWEKEEKERTKNRCWGGIKEISSVDELSKLKFICKENIFACDKIPEIPEERGIWIVNIDTYEKTYYNSVSQYICNPFLWAGEKNRFWWKNPRLNAPAEAIDGKEMEDQKNCRMRADIQSHGGKWLNEEIFYNPSNLHFRSWEWDKVERFFFPITVHHYEVAACTKEEIFHRNQCAPAGQRWQLKLAGPRIFSAFIKLSTHPKPEWAEDPYNPTSSIANVNRLSLLPLPEMDRFASYKVELFHYTSSTTKESLPLPRWVSEIEATGLLRELGSKGWLYLSDIWPSLHCHKFDSKTAECKVWKSPIGEKYSLKIIPCWDERAAYCFTKKNPWAQQGLKFFGYRDLPPGWKRGEKNEVYFQWDFVVMGKEFEGELEEDIAQSVPSNRYIPGVGIKENPICSKEYIETHFQCPISGSCRCTGHAHLAGCKSLDFSPEPHPKGCGEPVYAAAGGTVITAGSHPSYGNYVIIQHEDGLQTLYAHLDSIKVEEGKQVEKGTQIGTIGNTGNSTGCHLHFEIRYCNLRRLNLDCDYNCQHYDLPKACDPYNCP